MKHWIRLRVTGNGLRRLHCFHPWWTSHRWSFPLAEGCTVFQLSTSESLPLPQYQQWRNRPIMFKNNSPGGATYWIADLREVTNLSHSVDSRLTSSCLNRSRISWRVLVLPLTADPPSVVFVVSTGRLKMQDRKMEALHG